MSKVKKIADVHHKWPEDLPRFLHMLLGSPKNNTSKYN